MAFSNLLAENGLPLRFSKTGAFQFQNMSPELVCFSKKKASMVLPSINAHLTTNPSSVKSTVKPAGPKKQFLNSNGSHKKSKELDKDAQKEVKVSMDLNPIQKLAAAALNFIESSLIASEKEQPLPKTADPQVQISGNFAPVSESPVKHELQVLGTIPECLEGFYVRNGANPRFEPSAGHHLFDGDGMIHAVGLKHGGASYCCRFTRTHRLCEEEKIGRAIFPKPIGELHGHSGLKRLTLFIVRSLFRLLDSSQGMGVANAGLIFFNRRLLAMSEDDLPYAVRVTEDGELRTLGRFDFDGQLKSSMIAHPKIDPETGELFALSYDVIKKPYLKYFIFHPDGTKGPDVTISLKEPTMMHDFVITKNYVVVPDQQIVVRPLEMVSGGSPAIYEKQKIPRFGVLPRYDSDESRMKWIHVPDCFCFHFWNAWEDGEEIVVIGSCMTPPDSIFNESDDPLRSHLSEIRLNTKKGTSSRREIAPLNLEAGQINRNYVGRKTQYAYLAIVEPWPKVSGIAKVDLQAKGSSPEERVVGKIIYKEGCYGGEPFFVPRTSDPSAAEDDGYVLTFMHNETTSSSQLLILDARSSNLNIVASVQLPSRVPYGFHGTYLTSEDLAKQIKD